MAALLAPTAGLAVAAAETGLAMAAAKATLPKAGLTAMAATPIDIYS